MKISDSEMKIMKIIWESNGEVTSTELIERLGDVWKPTTILTFLKRLVAKGAINARRKGRISCYSATITENEYKQAQTEEFINEIHDGSLNSLLSALCTGDKIDKKELDDIKKWFDEL